MGHRSDFRQVRRTRSRIRIRVQRTNCIGRIASAIDSDDKSCQGKMAIAFARAAGRSTRHSGIRLHVVKGYHAHVNAFRWTYSSDNLSDENSTRQRLSISMVAGPRPEAVADLMQCRLAMDSASFSKEVALGLAESMQITVFDRYTTKPTR